MWSCANYATNRCAQRTNQNQEFLQIIQAVYQTNILIVYFSLCELFTDFRQQKWSSLLHKRAFYVSKNTLLYTRLCFASNPYQPNILTREQKFRTFFYFFGVRQTGMALMYRKWKYGCRSHYSSQYHQISQAIGIDISLRAVMSATLSARGMRI